MSRDNLFSNDPDFTEFNFGEATAAVFDDMLERSVPLYQELQRMTAEITREFAQAGTRVYDLGCSTGTTLRMLADTLPEDIQLVAVDNSAAMLEKAKQNLSRECEWLLADLDQGLRVENASVAILNLTLQFVRPLGREKLIKNIYDGLRKNGCLILVEKVLGNDSLFNSEFIKFYYDMKKRNGYSEMEIARKRETLENVLIPYRVDENIALLENAGFPHIDIFFKWYNFCGFLAVK